ncbi:MAG: sodium:alanine symporter family protein [Ruminococcus sp.]|nr:sodium:alanine symporter family protein [Ruminococcus sp.]
MSFEKIENILNSIDEFVWGIPLIVLIISVGIYLTIRLRLMQLIRLPKALKYMFSNEEKGEGEISSFAALCTALSSTIGTGNIVGVATAVGILSGGPGALLWMWVAAFFGMATKFSEGFLAIKYRKIDKNGHALGGPFYYIEKGMGAKWKWLAKVFAFFGACVGIFGIGTFSQINGISSAVQNFFDPERAHTISIFGSQYTWAVVVSGLLVTVCAGLVIIGGIKRISGVSQIVVPFMACVYIISCLILIFVNVEKLPHAVATILKSAFDFKAVAGGTIPMFMAIRMGVARGIFSNESGLGSAPIAVAAAKTKEPVRQGLVSMCGTFIDTIIVCTMTGMAIIMMGSYEAINPVTGKPFEGVEVTTHAFQQGYSFLPEKIPAFVLMVCLVFFAFTTILGWNYYGERCFEYLTNGNKRAVKTYRCLYILAVFIGPYMTVSAVWTVADIFNGMMALPNLIAIVALSGIIVTETKDYFKRLKTENK